MRRHTRKVSHPNDFCNINGNNSFKNRRIMMRTVSTRKWRKLMLINRHATIVRTSSQKYVSSMIQIIRNQLHAKINKQKMK